MFVKVIDFETKDDNHIFSINYFKIVWGQYK